MTDPLWQPETFHLVLYLQNLKMFVGRHTDNISKLVVNCKGKFFTLHMHSVKVVKFSIDQSAETS